MSKKYDDLSKEELVRLLEARDRRDATRFGLVWEANEIERDKALNQDFVSLDLDRELSCPADPADGWRNLIIEGDNFDALRYLKMTFAGRIKCIYIDPPYNTGNKDFIYNDRFVDREDLWRHSKWCEFMFQRLTLAKDLLRQDGVVFVSIDDNEVSTLRLLMDRVFGATNFIATVVWQKKQSPQNDATNLSDMHDYIVIYAQKAKANRNDAAGWKRNLLPRTAVANARYDNPDNDPRGPWTSGDYTCNKTKTERPNLYYPIRNPNTGKDVWPNERRVWIVERDVTERNLREDRIWWGATGKNKPRFKNFLSDVADGIVPSTWWTREECGDNQEGRRELRGILPTGDDFSTPKPTRLIEKILRIATDEDDFVLDFFAGSGTTAHAVHKMNKESGGNRRVILVSNTEATEDQPDKNICRDVCATRLRRVIEGYDDTPATGGDFAYLRCRRIEPGQLDEIDHAQVWTSLQLTHMPTLTPFDDSKPLVIADNDEQRLIYLPHYLAKHGRALVKAVGARPACIVYTWQPDLIKARLRTAPNVEIQPVPETLARRFGIRI